MDFTGKAIPKGVSLPEDMWAYLETIRDRDGVPVSVQVQRAVREYIMERAARARGTLIDERVPYATG